MARSSRLEEPPQHRGKEQVASFGVSVSVRRALVAAREVAGWVRWTAGGAWFDLCNRVETTRHVSARDIGLNTSDGNLPYEPAGIRTLKRVFDKVPHGPEDTLVDLGCGKGRVVLWAAMHCRLKKVVGVEISEQLYGIATRNLARQPERIWLSPVELVCTDAAAFKIAPDVTLVFLNNPFMGEVFERVLSNILESVHTHPRVLRIIAIGAFMHERYLARGFTLRQLGRGMFEYTVRPPTDV